MKVPSVESSSHAAGAATPRLIILAVPLKRPEGWAPGFDDVPLQASGDDWIHGFPCCIT